MYESCLSPRKSLYKYDTGRWSSDSLTRKSPISRKTKEIEMIDIYQTHQQKKQQVFKRLKNESSIPISKKLMLSNMSSLRSTSDSSIIQRGLTCSLIETKILCKTNRNLSQIFINENSIPYLRSEGLSSSPDFVLKKVIRVCTQRARQIYAVIYDHSGQNVISAGADGCIRFFRTDSFLEWHLIPTYDGEVLDIAISSDDTYIASCHSQGRANVWHILSKQNIKRLPDFKGKIQCITYLSTSNKIAMCYARTIWISDLDVFNNDMAVYCDSICFCISITHDDLLLISGHNDGKIRIWDMTRQDLNLEETLHDGAIIACKVSPSDDYLATTSRDNTIVIYDLRYCSIIHKLRDLAYMTISNYTKICWSYDEKFVISGGSIRNKNRGGVFVWDTIDLKLANILLNEAGKAPVIACEWNPCKFEMVTGDVEGNIVIWN